MTIIEMLEQSGVLTLLGMGIVFVFLVILVIAVTIMGKVIQAHGRGHKSEVPAGEAPAVIASAQTSGNVMGPVIAAIITAVNEYRKDN
jgi:oxaloacetate decarboxylase gamma subunit